MGKFKTLETDLERLQERIEAENEAKAEIQKAMSRALAEAQIWKSKYTTEACARIEDLENAKAKLLVRLITDDDNKLGYLHIIVLYRQESVKPKSASMV